MTGTRTPIAGRLCQGWVRFYTWKLPDADARRRREEIESDLFEHANDAQLAGVGEQRLNAEILARVLVGVPADLSWRRASRQEPLMRLAVGGIAMSMSKSTQHRILYWLSGLIVLYCSIGLVSGIASIFVDWDEEPSVAAKIFFFGVPVVSAITLVAGLVTQSRDPRRGLALVIAGAVGPAVWFWMLPFYAPVMIAVIALAVSVTPRKSSQAAIT
ncbi:MAG: hypothetical protein ACR2P0_17710 [Acidimicrobiales bacterium]